MVNFLIAYDDNDSNLGDYFEASYKDISTAIVVNHYIAISSIRGLDCTQKNVNTLIDAYNYANFIFVGLSHGNEEELVATEVFVSKANALKFDGALFYTCACSCGHTLGNNLIASGCLCYIGHRDTAYIIEDYHDIFYKCQNFAIKNFVLTSETIGESYDKMIDYYNSEIDRLVLGDMDDTIAASTLVENRDVLVIYGNRNLTLNDFVVL